MICFLEAFKNISFNSFFLNFHDDCLTCPFILEVFLHLLFDHFLCTVFFVLIDSLIFLYFVSCVPSLYLSFLLSGIPTFFSVFLSAYIFSFQELILGSLTVPFLDQPCISRIPLLLISLMILSIVIFCSLQKLTSAPCIFSNSFFSQFALLHIGNFPQKPTDP